MQISPWSVLHGGKKERGKDMGLGCAGPKFKFEFEFFKIG
jgi:hypothetical protein